MSQTIGAFIDKTNEIEIPHGFTDSISSLSVKQVSPGIIYLAAGSWDGNI
jgi:hypothetical protein